MIYTSKNISELKNVPVLDDGEIYIYIMLNYPQGNIKIGQTTNIQQRLQSLSGSNNGGNHIVKLYYHQVHMQLVQKKHFIIIMIDIEYLIQNGLMEVS